MFELFLDEKGQKISKSKGNGITIDEWLRYAPPESLSYYMFQTPRRAKKLYFDVIPQQVDDYLTWIENTMRKPMKARSPTTRSGISMAAIRPSLRTGRNSACF